MSEQPPIRLVPRDVRERGEAQAVVIRHLEDWLARAKAGEIDAIAVAALYSDGANGSSDSPAPSYLRMLGAIADLQWNYARAHE